MVKHTSILIQNWSFAYFLELHIRLTSDVVKRMLAELLKVSRQAGRLTGVFDRNVGTSDSLLQVKYHVHNQVQASDDCFFAILIGISQLEKHRRRKNCLRPVVCDRGGKKRRYKN